MKMFKHIFLAFAFLMVSFAAQAQNGYVGTWKTIDDNTGEAKAHVEIYEQGGKLFGKIVKLLDPASAGKKCTACSGAKKNQPIEGLVMLENLKKKGSYYGEGSILDPENGKTYKCFIELENGGSKLRVRGFIGFAALGRTQYWHKL